MPAIRRILCDAEHVRRISEEVSGQTKGKLSIATTHTHARYALVRVMQRFVREHPDVALHLRQGTPPEICAWVAAGEVDLGIGTAPIGADAMLVQMPCYDIRHSVVVPQGHPLTRAKRLTLERLAAYPLITNDSNSRLGHAVEKAFAARGIACNVVIRTTDTTVMKKYVQIGFGIAVLPSITIDPQEDAGLRALPADHLFRPETATAIMVRGQRLPEYGQRFMQLVTQRRPQAIVW